MKLIYRIILHTSLVLSVIITLWAFMFYIAIIDEINDEVDDSLEDYSEMLVKSALAGEEMPSESDGSNNQYYLTELPQDHTPNYERITFKDSTVYIHRKGETEPARIMTTIFRNDNGNFFELTVATPTIAKNDLKEAIFYWIIFLYTAMLITIVIVNILVFRSSMKPLYSLLTWLEHYRIGQKNYPLENNTNTTEFKKLNTAIILYTERNESIFEQQKQFISNASHELQTPLAICRNRLEILMEDESLTEKQLGEIIGVQLTLEQITKLNKSLLLLLRIDNNQFAQTSKIDIVTLIKRYLEDIQDVYAYKGITANIDAQSNAQIYMNESLAITLVTNLLKNAFIHNIINGYIRINISKDSIIFSNSGKEHPLNEELIFNRFYKGDGAEESTGLGLAIVHSICKLHNMPLSYYYENKEHNFKIFFSK